ncbi:MAG: NTP/NDP exchange transporter [Candidatus Cardinium sp.]|uniref:Npt1/Npt2 family nucleotide transporter n=1 Tax=Cardinium endosymbiont of Dermatophagoides farinae TaxID=2597823 RepID=UPI0011832DA1|nr:NTP/NDP exchange transporter [Cardinium endosymbiont of Dermatophagoides farinae]TSJ80558.1 ADP/ATP carrier protein [Cardinium endosymbiont of Dermatophagoides farinae]UWW96537.1 MAG: NTP/NDP exchange transporter [Candidatus Cardinium sp.]
MKQVSALLKKWHPTHWRIKGNGLQKFFCMAILMFLILLNQNLIRGIKDSLVVTLIGAEVLSFIKLFVEMPAGILFVVIYTILCNKMTTENIFRGIILFFLFFFMLFGFFLFPYQELLHPDPCMVDDCISLYPHFKWFFVMWGKWTLVLFYMIGELWPMIVFTLLYWQLANKITKTEEAGRFYFFCNLVGQANLLISGSIMVYFSSSDHFLLPFLGVDKTETALKIAALMVIVVLLCLFILFLHRYIEKHIVYGQTIQAKRPTTLQLGLYKSFKMISRSKYLGLICVLMISYSMVIHLIEGLWFHETSLLYKKDPTSFITYQGKVLFWTGICTLICSCLGSAIIRKLSWLGAALVTPIVTLVVGSCFFLFIIAAHFNFISDAIMGISTLAAIVAIGGLQNVLAKGTKYCFFDVTKEVVYIPLDREMGTKGKAAVDILGGKIGKSAGAALPVICYTIFPGAKPNELAPFLMVMFFVICIIWITAVGMLSKKYHSLIRKTDCLMLSQD